MRMKEAAKEADVAESKFELDNFFRVTFKRSPLQPATSSDICAVINDINVLDNVQDKNGVNVYEKKALLVKKK